MKKLAKKNFSLRMKMQKREVDTNPKKGLRLCSTLCHEVGPLVGDILLLALELP